MTEGKPRRVSITKLQRQTAAGTELITLCQTVTEDGSLVDEEVAALSQWLADNQDTDLPAKDFLWQTVERIVADGKVTAEERQDLYKAIETVLPPDIRELARNKRRAAERTAKEVDRVEREAARTAAQQARQRNSPLQTWDFMVAGTRYEGRPEIISRHAIARDTAFLARDPANRYSRNAVEVRLPNGMQIGFVPEEDAVEMAPLLDAGHPHDAYIKKILTGGRAPIPVVVASVYSTDAKRTGLIFQADVPAKALSSSASKWPGCTLLLALGVALIAAAVVVLVLSG